MRGFDPIRRSRGSTRVVVSAVSAAMLLAAALAPVSMAAAPTPSAGSATVDGDPSEWSVGADFFSDMTDAGDASKPVRAKLWLRYDCDAEVLYALVLATGDEQVLQSRPAEAYLRIDGSGKLVSGDSGNDGTAPDFAWVNGDGSLADGFEASGPLGPGEYTLRAHVLVADDSSDGYTPMDTVGRDVPLVIDCGDEEPVVGTPTPTPTPTGGSGPTDDPTEKPDGNVGGATGTPRTTLPPTDTVPGTAAISTSPDGLRLVLAALAVAILASAFVLPAIARATVAVREDDPSR